MPATIEEPSQELLERTRAGTHAGCVVCGSDNLFRLHFTVEADGGVVGEVTCPDRVQGYAGVVQGGVVAALLDSAMANQLFARGIAAFTAELTVRYSHPTHTGRPMRARGWLVRTEHALYRMQAEITQEGRVTARARATFLGSRPAA